MSVYLLKLSRAFSKASSSSLILDSLAAISAEFGPAYFIVASNVLKRKGGGPKMVFDFLQWNKGLDFCDDCIQKTLDLKLGHQVQQITAALALCAGFVRGNAKCSVCKRDKEVIRSK